MNLVLRPYQSAAINHIYSYFEHKTGNPLVVIPTAGGKSLVMAKFIEEVLTKYPDQRILVVTHVKELIKQNYDELKTLWPEAPAGIYSAGLKKREIQAQILFAGIQSIHDKAIKTGQCDLVLIDEAHLIPKNADTMYQRFLSSLKSINPLLKVIGFTATPYRLDSGLLHKSENAVFSDIAFEISVRKLIDDGYLSRVVSKRTATQIDVSAVGTRAGDFIAGELEAAIDIESITKSVVREICKQAFDRKSWLVFCVGVGHAYHVRDEIRRHGISCETIVGTTPSDERDALIEGFRAGRIQCLTNANVLTTGFNVPNVDMIAMLRPTKSAGLYVQIIGRGCRLAKGKENCLILDFAGNIARHGPIDVIKTKRDSAGNTSGESPTKVCPNCQSYVHAATRDCPDCGYEFPVPEIDLAKKPSQLDVLSTGKPQWIDVSSVFYARHDKPGKKPSLKVDYRCGLSTHSEWICLEHPGYAGIKASSWWAKRAPGMPRPKSINEALSHSAKLKKPIQIAIKPSGKYTEIVSARFS
jgi:DNA repair protein RadD